jgi:mRNA interferase MazF
VVKRTKGRSAAYVPERGQAVWLDFDPQAGHEQAGRRPALVLSPSTYNGKAGLAIFCPITNQAKDYPFEVPIPAGLRVSGTVLADQVKCLDWRERRADFICELPEDTVAEALAKMIALLSPEEDEEG